MPTIVAAFKGSRVHRATGGSRALSSFSAALTCFARPAPGALSLAKAMAQSLEQCRAERPSAMYAPLAFVVLLVSGGAAWAQPLNGAVNGLESCFVQARLADSICSKGELNPAQRLDCLQKARNAQLECLEHVQQGVTTGSNRPKPSAAAAPESPATVPSMVSPGTASPAIDVARASPTPAKQPDGERGVTGSVRPQDSNWIVSEVATAMIRSTFSTKHGPNSMIIRCTESQTELLLRTEGRWRRTPAGDVQVEYRINTQPPIVSRWASADRQTVTYKGDAVGLLQSLGDDTRISVTLSDGVRSGHSAIFQLGGFDAVRNKMGSACKWAIRSE